MLNRLLALLAVTLGVLVVGLASTAAGGGLAGVEVARAQSPAPPAETATPPDSGADDTAVGGLDASDPNGSVDTTDAGAATPPDSAPADATPADTTVDDAAPADAAPADAAPADAAPADAAPADAAPDPDAGLDDTPSGGLDQTGLGGPVDDQAGTGTDTGTDTGTGSGTDTGTTDAPAPAPDPDAGLDDTPAGCLDQGGLGGPIDDTGAAGGTSTDAAGDSGSCTATGTDPGTGSSTDPEAGLDDTPVGGLDSTGLGGPIDDTNQPPADTPPSTTPDPSPAPSGGAPAPGGAAPAAGAPGATTPPVYVFVNVPSSSPTGSAGKPATKHKASSKKRKSAKKKHKSSRKRHSTRNRKHGGSRRHAKKHSTSGRVGLDLRPQPIALAPTTTARDRARRPNRAFVLRGSVAGLR